MGGIWNSLHRAVRLLIETYHRFGDKGGWVMSSHVAMSLLLALFPFLLFVVSLAGFLAQDVAPDALIALIFGSWPEAIEGPITREMRAVLLADHGGLVTLGGALTLIFASNGVNAIREAMVRAYRGTDPRPYWAQRLLCLGFVLVAAASVLSVTMFGVVLPLYVAAVEDAVPALSGLMRGSEGPARLLALGVLILAVVACHLWLPPERRELGRIWPGVVLTVVCWVAGTEGFALYLSHFASYSATYAGLAGAMSALIFLYAMAVFLIFGAELNSVLEDRRDATRA